MTTSKLSSKSVLTLSKQQIIWLKDLVTADINDWEKMMMRPVDEVGVMFARLAKTRIDNMQAVFTKLDAMQAVDTIRKVCDSGLMPEIIITGNDILAVVLGE